MGFTRLSRVEVIHGRLAIVGIALFVVFEVFNLSRFFVK